MNDLHKRIALALGPKWTEKDVASFSLPTMREMVRERHPALAAEIADILERGAHIFGEPVRNTRRKRSR